MNRTFFVAGVQFRPPDEISKAMREIKIGDRLNLLPEPSNRFDPNAVKIIFVDEFEGSEMIFLGYVPKKFSAEVSAMLEAEVDLDCIVEEVNPSAHPWEMCKVTIKEVEDETQS